MNKIKVLSYHDCPFTTTGFGTVSKYILKALHSTGRYEIDVLGINYFADFYDKEQYPYNVLPARLDNPQDPYGQQMFLKALSTGKYDLVFIINDTFVVQRVAEKINEIRAHLRKEGRPVFKLIYYYPIDCHLLPQHATMVQIADQPVAYTKFGINETLKVLPDLADRLTYIYHGTDINNFRPLPDAVRMARRHAFLQAKPSDFVMVSVNRNSIRKDLPMTLLAFKKFKDKHPEANARLYLHTMPVDTHGYDLRVPLQELGLDPRTDVAFPVNYNTHTGFPVEVMNDIYNMADCFITNTRGEGWGLSALESAAAGIPVICPDNTVHPEIFGQEKGFMYKCTELSYNDNSGFRPIGTLNSIVETIERVWKLKKNKPELLQQKVKAARAFAEQYSWDVIGKQWIELFDKVLSTPHKNYNLQPTATGEFV